MKKEISEAVRNGRHLLEEFEKKSPLIEEIAALIVETLNNGNKVLICGNGGSAAEAQHMAAEFSVRFLKDRRAFAAVSLTSDTSVLTAAANDYSFEKVFSRQVEALGKAGDILIGFSTSGNSANVLSAFEKAREKGLKTVAVTGRGGAVSGAADYVFKVESEVTARIQEIHLLFIHLVCEIVENQAA